MSTSWSLKLVNMLPTWWKGLGRYDQTKDLEIGEISLDYPGGPKVMSKTLGREMGRQGSQKDVGRWMHRAETARC